MSTDSSDDAKTRTRPIRVPMSMWDAYGEVCKALGTDRTKDLLAHMRRQINKHGTEQQIDKLAEADAELAERRSRMHPGRPKKNPQPKDAGE